MSAPIAPVSSALNADPISSIDGIGGLSQPAPANGLGNFSDLLQKLSSYEVDANNKAEQLATGKLTNIHDYTVAAAKATLAIELTTALRNKAVEAYQEIMRMQV